MEILNFEKYYYDLNIANYETWSDEKLQKEIDFANKKMEQIQADIYDSGYIKKALPPSYVVDGYRWAKNVIFKFELELKNRGVIAKDENDLWLEELFNF